MTLLIKNALLLGAREEPGKPFDVFISGEKISAIGDFPHKGADIVFDAQRAYLAPAFIDPDTTSDHYLTVFDNPGQEDFLKQGTGTIIGGHCGSSLAPLLYGSLESMRKWRDTDIVNVDWHTTKEFFRHIEKHPLGVNFGTLTGHATLRRALVGDAVRDLTKNEFRVFEEAFSLALAEGSFGISFGLEYIHGHDTPEGEIIKLAQLVAKKRRVVAMHLRDTGVDLPRAFEEAVRIGEASGTTIFISHLLPIAGFEREYESVLEKIDKLPENFPLYFGVHPFETTTVPLYRLLPPWARKGNLETMAAQVHDGWMVSKIMKEISVPDPKAIVIAYAPDHPFLAGKTLEEIRESSGAKNPEEALMELMVRTNLRAVVHQANIAPALLTRALMHPRSLIASHAPGVSDIRFFAPSKRSTATFTEFIARSQKEGVEISATVKKLTSLPANIFGIKNRGACIEGAAADLVCFALKQGTDGASSCDVKCVVVNGAMAAKDGAALGTRTGKTVFSSR